MLLFFLTWLAGIVEISLQPGSFTRNLHFEKEFNN